MLITKETSGFSETFSCWVSIITYICDQPTNQYQLVSRLFLTTKSIHNTQLLQRRETEATLFSFTTACRPTETACILRTSRDVFCYYIWQRIVRRMNQGQGQVNAEQYQTAVSLMRTIFVCYVGDQDVRGASVVLAVARSLPVSDVAVRVSVQRQRIAPRASVTRCIHYRRWFVLLYCSL